VGSIVPSDASHLASVSCSSSISDKFLETSENAPGAEEVSERCDEASEFTNNQCTDVNTSNLDEVEEVQSIPGGRSIAHHTHKVPGPRVQADYIDNFNVVDRND
jgi:hypothetical protein